MKVASVAEVKADFGGYLKASEQGPVVVTRSGKPVAVLVRTRGQGDVERLLMGHSPQLQAILEAARKRFRSGAGIPHVAFWKEVEAENAGKVKKQRSRTQKSGRRNR
jgi:antitoxin (DNA-binding transcriptional repressor) of toxin-antitoxin stability system